MVLNTVSSTHENSQWIGVLTAETLKTFNAEEESANYLHSQFPGALFTAGKTCKMSQFSFKHPYEGRLWADNNKMVVDGVLYFGLDGEHMLPGKWLPNGRFVCDWWDTGVFIAQFSDLGVRGLCFPGRKLSSWSTSELASAELGYLECWTQ